MIRKRTGANPELTVTYSGFVRGEDATVFTRSVQISTTATLSFPFGYYDIIPFGAAAVNYQPIYENGRLTVSAADERVRALAVSRSSIQLRIECGWKQLTLRKHRR